MTPAPVPDRLGGRDMLFATLVVSCWGLNYAAVKLSVTELPPLFATALRFAIVAVLVMPFVRLKREQIPALLLLSLTMGSLHFGVLFYGMVDIDAATAAIVLQTTVPFGVLVGALFFHERIGPRRALGVLLGFAGVVVLAGEPGGGSPPLSIALLLLAAICWAGSSALFKVMPSISSLAYIGGTALFAVPQMLAASWLLEDGQTAAMAAAGPFAWGGVIFSAIAASIVGHGLWYGLVQRHELSLVVPFTLLAPVIGVATAVTILGEPMSLERLLGGCLTLSGVALIQFSWPRRRTRSI
ncbi:MAG: DMT family transporter [Rhodospirillaceae bacterium]